MKHTLHLLLVLIIMSCSSDQSDPIQETTITIDFKHEWDGIPVTKTDFNTLKYTNAIGEQLSIERLRYLLSEFTLTSISGVSYSLEDYLLIDINENLNLSYNKTIKLPDGSYNLSFRFGFSDDQNVDGVYPDLNTASFDVPMMLGGGYHYMQFDGKYTSATTTTPSGFNYHTIRAVNNIDPSKPIYKDTSFLVTLGEITVENHALSLEVTMNIAEWFKNPNEWDLNVLNQMLMPNYEAQILMSENGTSVFSL